MPRKSTKPAQIDADPVILNPSSIEGSRAWWERRGLDAGVGVWDMQIPFGEYVRRVQSPSEYQFVQNATKPMPQEIRAPGNLGVEMPAAAATLEGNEQPPIRNEGAGNVAGEPVVRRTKDTEWAYTLQHRFDRGEALNRAQIRCFRAALRLPDGSA